MLVSTTFTIEGYRITDTKGLVRGIIVRSPTILQGIFGGLKNIIGGRIGAYTEMCEQARQQAYDSMVQHAKKMGANAITACVTTPRASRPPRPRCCATARRSSYKRTD
jgi:uncharacterized protein YbjQ (UPF0145 family)